MSSLISVDVSDSLVVFIPTLPILYLACKSLADFTANGKIFICLIEPVGCAYSGITISTKSHSCKRFTTVFLRSISFFERLVGLPSRANNSLK